jgi:hypothetical protein
MFKESTVADILRTDQDDRADGVSTEYFRDELVGVEDHLLRPSSLPMPRS